MQKDHLRDYATDAFRFYARVGKLTGDEYIDLVRCEAIDLRQPKEVREINALHAASEAIGAAYDLDAVGRTLEHLELAGKREAVLAVKAVYFVRPSSPLGYREIAGRVRHFALGLPASERTVYRWLKLARRVFAKERGLRL